jgi:hypothetical protein
MPAHAGFAAAITIRDRVLAAALLAAYRAGQIDHAIVRSFGPLAGPRANVNLFFPSPEVVFSDTDPAHALLRFSGWGIMGVRLLPVGPGESRTVQWRADLRVTATPSSIGGTVFLSAKAEDYRLADWQFDVLSGAAFSNAAQAFFHDVSFTAQLETWLQAAVGDLLFPVVDFGFLGPFASAAFTTIGLKVVDQALLLGFDVDTGTFSTAGDLAELDNFAGAGDDIAVVINPDAVSSMMGAARQRVQDQIDEYDATLESLDIACEEGQFRVTGRASKTGGAVNFSLAVVPHMVYGRPGAFIPLAKKTMVVRSRTWRALWFSPTEPEVDVDRSWWVQVFVEGLLGAITLGFVTFAVEALISEIARNITGGIASSDLNPEGPTPLVRRFGDPPTRFAIERFEIHTSGIFMGISSRLEAPPPELRGLRSIPRTWAGRNLRYEVRLPFEALPVDPFLRIRWTVVDLDSGSVLLTDDGVAANRQRLVFAPAAVGPQVTRFAVGCRVYRALGPFATELLNETIRLQLGAPLAPGAFVRWRYDVKNPQIALDDVTDQYSYRGDLVVRRWSKFHRADKPCQNAQHRSRYVYSDEVRDDLPFPIEDMDGNRYRLCDYCFFGGPGSTVSSL